MNGDALDVIVRPGGAAALERCLFSLVMQDYAPLTVHLVVPEPAPGLSAAARTEPALAALASLNPRMGLRRHSTLAQALVGSRGRYLSMLDVNGTIYPAGFASLVAALDTSQAILGRGRIAAKFETVSVYARTTLDRAITSAEMLHGAVLDRRRTEAAPLTLEDGAALLARLHGSGAICAIDDVVGDLYTGDD